ncbi:polymer-forming cytoskeletal protein [Chloroflexi bacterium TSY]|nr:polymer-forming cytoskeletal protein [Chloroflexi bacterium TSY]
MKIMVWIGASIVLIVLALNLILSPHHATAHVHLPVGDGQHVNDQHQRLLRGISSAPYLIGRYAIQADQYLNGDLVIDSGETLSGDIVVYNGDVKIETEGTIRGSLVVYSGDVEIERGATVSGDVTVFSGDIDVSGRIDGDLATASGDIDLEETARVAGDVSVLSGDIQRDEKAHVSGDIVSGPDWNLNIAPIPNIPQFFPDTDTEVIVDYTVSERGFFASLFFFVLRVLGASLLTLLAVVGVGGAISYRPNYVSRLTKTARENLLLAFGAGLILNLVLLFVARLFVATFCLAFLGIVPIVGLVIINVLSWAGFSSVVGRRLLQSFNTSGETVTTAVIGAILWMTPIALFWAFGGFFRFIGLTALLVISSIGAGGVILPWVRRQIRDGSLRLPASVASGIQTSSTTSTASADSTSSTSVETQTIESSSAETIDDVESSMNIEDDTIIEGTSNTAILRESASDAKEPAQDESEAISLAASSEIVDEMSRDIDSLEADSRTVRVDDFTEIPAIGPTLSQRLYAANVRTFADLAEMTPEQIADIIGWLPEQVVRNDLIGQAKARIQ